VQLKSLKNKKSSAPGKIEVKTNIISFANYFWRGGSVELNSLKTPTTRF